MAARVYGTTYDAATGSIITTAVVSAPPYSVVNLGNGSYYFLTPGSASVSATSSAPNYNPQTQNLIVGDGSMNRLDFHLNHV